PCLRLAYKASEMGHSYQVVLNAANEVLVDAFLSGRIKYTEIPLYIEKMLSMSPRRALLSVGDILEFDKEIRKKTNELIS
ncbi:MAG: 1-deoxy-D-xylulose-5-phosphate reductoisomerase, partial [Eubacteriales bacterium]